MLNLQDKQTQLSMATPGCPSSPPWLGWFVFLLLFLCLDYTWESRLLIVFQGRGGGQASRMLRLLLVQRGPSPSRVHLAIALPQAPGIPGGACTHAPDTQRPPLWRGVFVNAPRSPCSERVRT